MGIGRFTRSERRGLVGKPGLPHGSESKVSDSSPGLLEEFGVDACVGKPCDHGVGEAAGVGGRVCSASRAARSSVRASAALAEALGRGGATRPGVYPAQIGHSEPGDLAIVAANAARRALGRPRCSQALATVRRLPGEMRGSVDDRAREVARRDDQVDRSGMVAEARQHPPSVRCSTASPSQRLPRRRPIPLHSGVEPTEVRRARRAAASGRRGRSRARRVP